MLGPSLPSGRSQIVTAFVEAGQTVLAAIVCFGFGIYLHRTASIDGCDREGLDEHALQGLPFSTHHLASNDAGWLNLQDHVFAGRAELYECVRVGKAGLFSRDTIRPCGKSAEAEPSNGVGQDGRLRDRDRRAAKRISSCRIQDVPAMQNVESSADNEEARRATAAAARKFRAAG